MRNKMRALSMTNKPLKLTQTHILLLRGFVQFKYLLLTLKNYFQLFSLSLANNSFLR